MQGHFSQGSSPAHSRALVGVASLLVLLTAVEVGAQRTPLSLESRRDLWLLGVSARLTLVSEIFPEPARSVPAAGLDPQEIGWSLDRGVVGNHDPRASRSSDRTRDAALLLPVVLSVATARSGQRWRDIGVASAVYGEALLLSKSLTHLGKVVLGRPRPGAYLPRAGTSDRAASHPVGSGAFHSMPSSHAAVAWTGASTAVTLHLLLRPRARGLERFGLGFLGGALAGATSALRVSSGAHFPTDVLAGAGIGMASGTLVPLFHRADGPLPGRRAFVESAGGLLIGTVVGLLLGS